MMKSLIFQNYVELWFWIMGISVDYSCFGLVASQVICMITLSEGFPLLDLIFLYKVMANTS